MANKDDDFPLAALLDEYCSLSKRVRQKEYNHLYENYFRERRRGERLEGDTRAQREPAPSPPAYEEGRGSSKAARAEPSSRTRFKAFHVFCLNYTNMIIVQSYYAA
jgi:hypothetical protein